MITTDINQKLEQLSQGSVMGHMIQAGHVQPGPEH